jgi:protein disulfide isomerase family A protein 3
VGYDNLLLAAHLSIFVGFFFLSFQDQVRDYDMSRVAFSFLVAVALLATIGFAEVGEEPIGEVIVLNDNNFDKVIAQHELLLVEFYAPWCGHCKALEPKYTEAAKLLAQDDATKNVRIAKLDADGEKKSGGRFGISGFPTIKLFRNGEVAEDFDGERTAEGIVAFMKKKAAEPANTEITSPDTLKTLIKASELTRPTLIGFFSDKTGVDFKIFKAVANKFIGKGIDIYHTATPSVLESIGFYSSGSAIHLYRPLVKPSKVVFRGTIFKGTLEKWVLEQAVPQVGVYSPDTEKLYRLTGSQVIRFVADNIGSIVTTKYLESLARHTKPEQNVKFAISELKDYKADVEAHCAKGLKVCILAQDGKGAIFGLQEEYSEDSIEDFIIMFLEKKLKPKIKSEPAPGPAKAGEVATIVGSTFEEYMKSDKDIFIKFYAPWCGHCKNLAPKWEELAKAVADEFSSVVVAKFDSTANDLPNEFKGAYPVEGFPTLFLSKKGARQAPKAYDGKRDVEDLKKWLLEQRSQ